MSHRQAHHLLTLGWVGLLAVGATILAMAGCASNDKPVTGPRTPTSVDQVKIYQKPPAQYEYLGVVIVHDEPEDHWDGDWNAGFAKMKQAAAALGANGLLLQPPSGEADQTVDANYQGTVYQVPMRTLPKSTVAEGIWVTQE